MAWFIKGKISGPGVVPTARKDESFPSEEMVRLSDSARVGGRLPDGSLPTELYLTRPRKSISNLFSACNGMMVVSRELRELIAEYEPENALFHPVDMFRSKTGPLIDEYYFLNLINPLDAIVPQPSEWVSYNAHADGRPSFNMRAEGNHVRLTVLSSIVSQRDVWVDVRQTVHRGFFVSDRFLDALVERQLKTIDKIAYCMEI